MRRTIGGDSADHDRGHRARPGKLAWRSIAMWGPRKKNVTGIDAAQHACAEKARGLHSGLILLSCELSRVPSLN
jgi:hypothetical protein